MMDPTARPESHLAVRMERPSSAKRNKKRPAHPKTKTSTMYRRVISPTKSSREMMRQVSGLGMEDPVFGTKEECVQHPSLVFDDMSIGDIAEDMRDLMSVASDPTARHGGGFDEKAYRANLAALEFELMQFNVLAAAFDEDSGPPPLSPMAYESVGTSASSSTHLTPEVHPRSPGKSRRRRYEGETNQPHASHHSVRNDESAREKHGYQTSANKFESHHAADGLRPPSFSNKQQHRPTKQPSITDHLHSSWNSSVGTSLASSKTNRYSTPTTPRQGRRRDQPSTSSRQSHIVPACAASVSNTDNLLIEAALALEKDGNADQSLIQEALNLSIAGSPIREVKTLGRSPHVTPTSTRTTKHVPRFAAIASPKTPFKRPPLIEEMIATPPTRSKQRALPSLPAIYPIMDNGASKDKVQRRVRSDAAAGKSQENNKLPLSPTKTPRSREKDGRRRSSGGSGSSSRRKSPRRRTSKEKSAATASTTMLDGSNSTFAKFDEQPELQHHALQISESCGWNYKTLDDDMDESMVNTVAGLLHKQRPLVASIERLEL